MKQSLFGTLILGIILGAAGQAHAAVVDFNLNGIVADAATSSTNTGAAIYNTWQTTLSGFSGSTTVNDGDVINGTVSLDQSITIPSSGSNPGSYNLISLYLTSSTVNDINIKTDTNFNFIGTVNFYDNSLLIETLGGAETTTASQIVPSILFFPPNNGPLTFDSISFNGYATNIIDATDPSNPVPSSLPIDSGFLYYATNTANAVPTAPVPEPPAIMLFGVGLLLLGAMPNVKPILKLA